MKFLLFKKGMNVMEFYSEMRNELEKTNFEFIDLLIDIPLNTPS